jgi:hypothetical protein
MISIKRVLNEVLSEKKAKAKKDNPEKNNDFENIENIGNEENIDNEDNIDDESSSDIQSDLENALEKAQALNDQKLVDQINNIITYYMRNYIIKRNIGNEQNIDI